MPRAQSRFTFSRFTGQATLPQRLGEIVLYLPRRTYNVSHVSQLDPASGPPPIPVPVQPLGYSTPWEHRRPGLITAIGVLCIVVACLSGLTNLASAFQGFGFYMVSAFTRPSTPTVSSSDTLAWADEKLTVG